MFSQRMLIVVVLGAGWLSACTEPLDEFFCSSDRDCEAGYGCNPEGKCVPVSELKIVVKTLNDAYVGEEYRDVVSASGGVKPYRWSLEVIEGAQYLDWVEIGADTGEIRNQAGKLPSVMAKGKIEVWVKDSSNRGLGQQVSHLFDLQIKECRGDVTCWEFGEQNAKWGCRQGVMTCLDGALSGVCVLDGWSATTDHCGDQCVGCDPDRADRCVEGLCVCGTLPGPCEPGKSCCAGECVDLNSSLLHCGYCGNACTPANVDSATCVTGSCGYNFCLDGYYDCDPSLANGCETQRGLDNCSSCGDDCDNLGRYPDTVNQSCQGGVCVYSCADGFADCDAGGPAEQLGCETVLGTVSDCAVCGDSCLGSLDGGKRCVDEGGVFRCGCLTGADCDGDDMCCPGAGGACTPHDTQHCVDCLTGCTIAGGGTMCVNQGGGVYECGCADDGHCKGDYEFSAGYCDMGVTDKCLCTATEMCAGTIGDMCCFVSGTNACVDLKLDARNCGICRVMCGVGETCANGACSCGITTTCPSQSGAPNCVGGSCVCFAYNGEPCPTSYYCCPGSGCCSRSCGSIPNNCCEPPKTWCISGSCCDSCNPDTNCN